jgi:hypothetical protein
MYYINCGPGSTVGIMGWTVRGSNPGGARFFGHVQTGPGARPAFPGGKVAGTWC